MEVKLRNRKIFLQPAQDQIHSYFHAYFFTHRTKTKRKHLHSITTPWQQNRNPTLITPFFRFPIPTSLIKNNYFLIKNNNFLIKNNYFPQSCYPVILWSNCYPVILWSNCYTVIWSLTVILIKGVILSLSSEGVMKLRLWKDIMVVLLLLPKEWTKIVSNIETVQSVGTQSGNLY